MSTLCAKIHLLIFSFTILYSCGNKDKTSISKSEVIETEIGLIPKPQIAEYIRNMYQDKNGHFWFGTNGLGAAHYNGDSISYFSIGQGFNGQQITGISEDLEKNIWFATDLGVVKYDWSEQNEGEKHFTNYTDQKYFDGQRFWSILADSNGIIWGGSSTDIFRFDGENWARFNLPYPDTFTSDLITPGTSWSITEDRAGNIWFSTNGYGAYKYDGQVFTQYSKKDGLADDSVDQIIQDSKGNMWFGTRWGGASRYDGKTFTNYTYKDSIGNNEVCVIYEDRKGNIWMSSEGFGVYCYDGNRFTNYAEKEGLGVRAVQTIFEDKEGRLWVGGGGGLYRFDDKSLPIRQPRFINVTRNGPWK